MDLTTNYKLKKPGASDYYSIDDFNDNSDVIDAALKAQSDDLADHARNKANPHVVTKAQVGLGDVPNVSTNDQTPTYTEAAELTDLTSGETLSAALGKLKKAVATLIAHIGSKANPHVVTKAQVGLGDVPNVSTNDQTPTYTEAAELTDLTSGEKLSAAFGKLKKAVAALIAHIGDKANPHGVTKTQVGLGSVPNVTTNNQTPTYTDAAELTGLTSGEKLSVAFGKLKKAVASLIAHIGNKDNPHEVKSSQVPVADAIAAALGLASGASTDDALGKLAADSVKIATGSYVGTGTSGSANPNSLTFDSPPKLLVVYGSNTINNSYNKYFGLFLRNAESYLLGQPATSNVTFHGSVAWEGNTITWYSTTGYLWQLNYSNQDYGSVTYNYWALLG